jgi:hypothetical protein
MMRKVETRQLRFLRASRKALALHDVEERQNQSMCNLVDWLNESAGTAAYDRVESLIRNIRQVRALLHPVSFPEFVKREMSTDGFSADIWEKINGINESLSSYKMWPRYTSFRTTVTAKTRTATPKLNEISSGPLLMEWWPDGEFETRAVHAVVRLEENHQLDFLLRCRNCGKWFFASRSWHKFCAERCRSDHDSHTDDGRKRRARYMREYRKRLKRMDEEMKKASRRKRGH